MKIILALILLCGLGTATLAPTAGNVKAVALWSDFLSFQARAIADPAGERILNYGGENENENFELLLERLLHVNDSRPERPLGLLVAALAAVGLVIETKRSSGANQAS